MRKRLRYQLLGMLLGCAGLVAGCATSQKALWNARVGNYTFDQTVLEMGPPDKTARLTDGTVVAEWVVARGQPSRMAAPLYAFPPYGATWVEPGSPDLSLRLTFNPDGRLREWRRVMK